MIGSLPERTASTENVEPKSTALCASRRRRRAARGPHALLRVWPGDDRGPFLRNALDFSFDSERLMRAARFGCRIAEVPARLRNLDDASSRAAVRLVLHRRGLLPLRECTV